MAKTLTQGAAATLLAFLQGACTIFGARTVEEPDYQVVKEHDGIEIRSYPPRIVAEVTLIGDQDEMSSRGFRILAGYIFGDNISESEIAMTTPVELKEDGLKKSQKISMTAPVEIQETQDDEESVSTTMSFTMPSKWSLSSLPKPTDERIQLKEKGESQYAVASYSGKREGQSREQAKKKLLAWLSREGYRADESQLIYASFNPPWTITWLKHNEVMSPLLPKSSN